uniref:Uncharacterized protein n=1 Tax=Ixodes ricinus TaxID=34613 RepID=A0A6B0UHW9_IXORI
MAKVHLQRSACLCFLTVRCEIVCPSRCSGITGTVYCGLKAIRVVSDIQPCPRMVAPFSESAGPRSESTPCVGASRRCSRRSLAMPLATPPKLNPIIFFFVFLIT